MARVLIAALAWCLLSVSVSAQGAQVAFGNTDHDASLPVEVTADALSVDQTDGSAVFEGNVLVGQGDMRLSARKLRIEYAAATETDQGGVSRILASGGVTLVSGPEAAEAEEAVYTLATGEVVMTGSVLLTQGFNALSGEKLVVDLDTGTGLMLGRVRTVIRPAGAQ